MSDLPPDLFPPLGAILNELCGGAMPVATSQAWSEREKVNIATCGCGHQQLLEPEQVRENYTHWRCEACHRQNSEVTYSGATLKYLPRYTDNEVARNIIDRQYNGTHFVA